MKRGLVKQAAESAAAHISNMDLEQFWGDEVWAISSERQNELRSAQLAIARRIRKAYGIVAAPAVTVNKGKP